MRLVQFFSLFFAKNVPKPQPVEWQTMWKLTFPHFVRAFFNAKALSLKVIVSDWLKMFNLSDRTSSYLSKLNFFLLIF